MAEILLVPSSAPNTSQTLATATEDELPRLLIGKESACQCRRRQRLSLISGWIRSPGERSGNPLQYACLGNPIDRGDWGGEGAAIVHAVAKRRTWLSTEHTCTKDINGRELSFIIFKVSFSSDSCAFIQRLLTSVMLQPRPWDDVESDQLYDSWRFFSMQLMTRKRENLY